MTFVEWAKTIDWQKINDVCDALDDLNDRQFRFIKGRFIEFLLEDCTNGELKHVDQTHKDFDCPLFNCTVELKSEVSTKLYNKKGLKKNFGVRFNNSMGTNKSSLDPSHVTDYVIITKKDGSILVDKKTVLQNIKYNGDGCILSLTSDDVTELSGKMEVKTKYNLNLKWRIDNILRLTIQHLDTLKE